MQAKADEILVINVMYHQPYFSGHFSCVADPITSSENKCRLQGYMTQCILMEILNKYHINNNICKNKIYKKKLFRITVQLPLKRYPCHLSLLDPDLQLAFPPAVSPDAPEAQPPTVKSVIARWEF